MVTSFIRAAVMFCGCTGLLACSQQAPPQYGSADPPAVSQHAKLCIAEGQPGATNVADVERGTWSITVSSEGGACPHSRDWGTTAQAYEVSRPPSHGRVTQEAQGGKTVVSYWPEHGYVGSDSFILRYPPRNVSLRYLVAVVP
jgi:hypothetical protein